MNNSDLKEKYDLFKPIIIYIDYINIEYQKYLNNKFADITPRDFTYLITIHYHPNISQRQLARLLMVSEVNVGQIIRRLEKNDLIYRDFDENNRSRRIINWLKKVNLRYCHFWMPQTNGNPNSLKNTVLKMKWNSGKWCPIIIRKALMNKSVKVNQRFSKCFF